ncbi:MAG TPA: hypothetical protein VHO70_02020 [Chitinispirillaceae bacterium]|nr:hypothetical protein [Chitinispirillaceae bacterium]
MTTPWKVSEVVQYRSSYSMVLIKICRVLPPAIVPSSKNRQMCHQFKPVVAQIPAPKSG